MANGSQMTLEDWNPEIFHTQTVGASVRPVSRSRLRGTERDSTESLGWFLKYSDSLPQYQKRIDPDTFSVKMLRVCYQATEDLISCGYSLKWTLGGTMCNGRYSTQKPTFPKTEKEYFLSDFLEDTVPQKYFLSTETIKKIVFP